jgi:hypothetical protein
MRALLVLSALALAASAQDKADLAVVHQIKQEAFQNSKVMDHMFYLTDVYGPRLTNSPGFHAAADWVIGRLKEWGLTNVHKEPYGPAFGKSWSYTRFEGHMIEPGYQPIIGFPLAWSEGTNGPVTADTIHAVLRTDADLERWKGKLRGKIVLTMEPREIAMSLQPMARRMSDADVEARMRFEPGGRGGRGGDGPPQFGPTPAGPQAAGGRGGRGGQQQAQQQPTQQFRNRLARYLKEEGALVVVQHDNRADGGTIFGSGGGSRDPKDPVPPPMVVIAAEHYNRIARLLQRNIPVKLAFDIRVKMGETAEQSYNIIAEIEGTRKKDELVMLGGHFDSWHGGTGATDNATGSSVAIEAVRILKTLGLKMDRTVRLALWSGEEQGLLGSIAYVKEHFADRADMKLKPEYHKLVAYYNDDTGTGKFRGIGVGGNEMVAPIFEAWSKPFRDLGLIAVTGQSSPPTQRPGGTDHTSFSYAGLNGFGFMQDPMEYNSRTHHSNMDVYDRVQRGDLMQAAAIEASFVYHTAVRPEQLPRVPMPAPRPWARPGENRDNQQQQQQ